MLLAATAGQIIGVVFLAIGGTAAYIYTGWYSYQYIRKFFSWPKWLAIGLSLGGFVTGIIVMMDEFHHTSMMGDNTRTWKNDPEKGIHILSWPEVRRMQKEGRLKVVEPPEFESSKADWGVYQTHPLARMIDNLYYNRKRLARRLIKLDEKLHWASPSLRLLVVHEGRRALNGRINIELVRAQTCQHPDMAERGVKALINVFGGDLGPLVHVPEDDEDFADF